MKRTIMAALALLSMVPTLAAGNVKGRVTSEGKPLQGVQVSDGKSIVLTDENGRYEIDSDKRLMFVFITTPSGYVARGTDALRPGFYQPLTLPADRDEIHDFILEPQDQSSYRVIFIPDLHLSNDPRRDDINRFRNEVMPVIRREVSEKNGPVYTLNLGDFTHDIYWYEFDFNESDGLRLLQDIDYPTPVYSVTGNHDHDGAIVGENVDFRAAWRYRDVWGPDRYSVNIGNEHWVFLDDIVYKNIEGQGKKAPGIKGDRSYGDRLTAGQMAWLEKDLAAVTPGQRVCICCHCPVLRSTTKKGYYLPDAQVTKLDSLAATVGGIDIYSGHIHCWDICDHEQFRNLHQYSLPAASGVMWETRLDWPLTSGDGSNSGLMIADFAGTNAPERTFETYSFGQSELYRVYDMNEVGKAYKASAEARAQAATFPDTRDDYAQKKWRNYVFVNYWGMEPGEKVELFEKGVALEAEHNHYDDPLHTFTYDLPRYTKDVPGHSKKAKGTYINHLYEFRTKSAKTPVTLRITAADGTIRYEETIQRPKAFDPSGK